MAVKKTISYQRNSVNVEWPSRENVSNFTIFDIYVNNLIFEGKSDQFEQLSNDNLIKYENLIFFDDKTANDFIDFRKNHPLVQSATDSELEYCKNNEIILNENWDWNYNLPS